MQDEINEKTVALYIKTGKLTAEMLQKAMKAAPRKTDLAPAYEAEHRRFQHRDHRRQYQSL